MQLHSSAVIKKHYFVLVCVIVYKATIKTSYTMFFLTLWQQFKSALGRNKPIQYNILILKYTRQPHFPLTYNSSTVTVYIYLKKVIVPPHTKLTGVDWNRFALLFVCLYVLAVSRRTFVHLHGIACKCVHKLNTMWRCAPAIFIKIKHNLLRLNDCMTGFFLIFKSKVRNPYMQIFLTIN